MLWERSLVLKQRVHGVHGDRRTEIAALHLIAAIGNEKSQLPFGLHPFGQHLHLQAVGHVDNGAGNGDVLRRRRDVVHEGAVHFHHIDRQRAQVA
ncbi:hypothetical protein D3C71_1602060 [compost metagenome]